VHASSPQGAVEQLALMALMGGTELRRAELVDYVRSTVDVFVQLGRDGGSRLVTGVTFGGVAAPPAGNRNQECSA
jgi:type IV secretion system protein VirB11